MALLIGGGVIIVQLRENNGQPQTPCSNCITLKRETRRIYNGVITFDVPIGWNTYINGDTQELDARNITLDFRNAFTSGSSEDRPITFSDLNWQQLDFYVVNRDLIGVDYKTVIKNTPTETMTDLQTEDFEGYFKTTILPTGEQPSKANTGGTTYYLRPKIDQPKWNLIIDKQALGDNAFEAAVKKIIESIHFRVNNQTK